MICPHCQSHRSRKLNRTTDLGYAAFRCPECRRKFNERTGTPFNFLEFPTDIVFEIVLCRLLYKLTLRDLAQMFLLRGFEFTHEAVREWEERFAPLLADQIRRKRKGKVGRRWYVDETYLKVKGKWWCAGNNRHGVEDERASRKGSSDPFGPEFCVGIVKCPAKRKQGKRWAGYRASKSRNQGADAV